MSNNLFNLDSTMSEFVAKSKDAVNELQKIDTCLKHIQQTDKSLSDSDLVNIGTQAYEIAEKYGRSVTEYLSCVETLSKSGYQNAASLAELVFALQSAGNLTSDLSQQYVIATANAYSLDSNIQALNQSLDGANNISNLNAVSLSDLAEGMSIIASQAASAGIQIDEVTAALGTMTSTTQLSGTETAAAFRSILASLNSLSSDGQNPMEQLQAMSQLTPQSSLRSNLYNSLSTDDERTALNALLNNWSLYEKMIHDYSNASGSITTDAIQNTNTWESAISRLSTSFTRLIDSFTNQDVIIDATNALTHLLDLIAKTGPVGAIGFTGLSVGITAFMKNLDYPVRLYGYGA